MTLLVYDIRVSFCPLGYGFSLIMCGRLLLSAVLNTFIAGHISKALHKY